MGTSSNNSADYCWVYNYYSATPPGSCSTTQVSGSDNGNVQSYWYNDNVNTSLDHTATYGYDGVNRLTSASATPVSPGTVSYSQSFLYTLDGSNGQYGNVGCTLGSSDCPQLTFDPASNHVLKIGTLSVSYDADGDLLQDMSNSYTWDAEQRLSTVAGRWTALYNALGQRVQKQFSDTADYLYDPSGQLIGTHDVPANHWDEEDVEFGGRTLVYFSEAGAGTRFFHVNALGSVGFATRPAGNPIEAMLYYPYGETWQDTTGAIWDERFAGMMIRDADFDQYATPNRQNSPSLGRWMRPDPAGMAATDPANPQSWNRYAYVLNNPANGVDPSGLQVGYGGDSFGDCYMDGLITSCSDVRDALKSGFAQLCDGPCPDGPPVHVTGGLYGNHVNVNFDSWDQYADWRTTLASSPASQVYDAFWDLLENQGADPNQPHQVQVFWWGLLPNVGGMGPLNTANAAKGAVSDPYKGTHPGGSFIKLWPPLDTPHCANTSYLGGVCHNDAFSSIWLLPLHELFDYLPSLFINPQNPNAYPKGVMPWTCLIIGGCHQ